MNKIVASILLTYTLCTHAGEQYPINGILAVIYHDNGSQILLDSDLRPTLEGQPRTIRQVLLDNLIVLDATRLHIDVTTEETNRFLSHLQKENGLSRDAIFEVFKSLGYTEEEGLEEVRRKQIIEQVIDRQVRSKKRFLVQKEEVQKAFDANPPKEEATYTIVQAFVPTTDMKYDDIMKRKNDPELRKKITWDEPFTFKESELAESIKHITTAPVDSIVFVEKVTDGSEITRLVSKTAERPMTLEECYMDIASELTKGRYYELLGEYQTDLLKNAKIRFTDPEMTIDTILE